MPVVTDGDIDDHERPQLITTAARSHGVVPRLDHAGGSGGGSGEGPVGSGGGVCSERGLGRFDPVSLVLLRRLLDKHLEPLVLLVVGAAAPDDSGRCIRPSPGLSRERVYGNETCALRLRGRCQCLSDGRNELGRAGMIVWVVGIAVVALLLLAEERVDGLDYGP